MAYFGLITNLRNVRKDPNSDRLYLADCFNEGVIVGEDAAEGQIVLYLPADGKIERWFGDKFKLFRKNLDGTEQGGYLEDNGHIKAIKLRGNESAGIVIDICKIFSIYGEQPWDVGDKVDSINGKKFCEKYVPKRKSGGGGNTPKTSYKGRKAAGIIYPEFAMHSDTEQLAYNTDKFREGDILNMTLKMHGTSQRSMRTYAELPRGFFRRLFHMKPKTEEAYVLGTRRCVVTSDSNGYYGNDKFRFPHHERIARYVKPGMEVFYEVVGWYGPGMTDTIMPIADNSKVNDKKFRKKYGPATIFSYGCEPGSSKMFVYRITENNGEYEYTPDEITHWCEVAGVDRVPIIEDFVFTSVEDLNDRINRYFEDLTDPVGKNHVKEGVVVRIVNRRTFTAFKQKTLEFKILEGIVKDTADAPDMEEADDEGV